jgi:hypothetical protein
MCCTIRPFFIGSYGVQCVSPHLVHFETDDMVISVGKTTSIAERLSELDRSRVSNDIADLSRFL